MKLLFTGDVCFMEKGILSYQESADILQDVKPVLEKADFRIMNLETPLANATECEKLPKSGPNIISPPENVVFLQAAGADVATIANNHINDYLETGLVTTLTVLDQAGIKHCGAGRNLEEAYRAAYLNKDGKKVAILSICENEPGYATETTCGSAGLNILRLMKRIREEKQIADYVVIVFHGGTEYNPIPAPGIQERYRTFIEMGADAVIAGHTHCPQGYEVYNGKPIVYSLGNFLFVTFDAVDDTPGWNYGSMCMLTLEESGISFELIPYRFDTAGTRITPFTGEEKAKMMEYLATISAPIGDMALSEKYFRGWAISHQLYPKTPTDYNVDKMNFRASNLVRCEAHHECLKMNYQTIKDGLVDEALEWAEKIEKLQHMPV